MNPRQKFGWLLLLLLTGELPALANNPPQPDGLFSILLILPIAILAGKLAGIAPLRKSMGARIGWGIVLAAAVLLLMAGTELGALAALAVTIYAVVRAVQVVRRGQGAKRLVAAGVLVLFSVFAFADYFASIADLPHRWLFLNPLPSANCGNSAPPKCNSQDREARLRLPRRNMEPSKTWRRRTSLRAALHKAAPSPGISMASFSRRIKSDFSSTQFQHQA